jgi:ATP-dependent RNA helicase DeaD
VLPDHLPSPLAQALTERGYSDLTPVQAAVVAPEAAGRDLLVSARTGSGKTVAFGLGIAPTLLEGADRFAVADRPLALVIAPTRELAMQVQRELAWLYAPAGGRIVATVGGMDPRKERRALEGGCHIVVGTPGRLRDHVERKALDLSALSAVVLDEADEMLDMGFKEDLEFLLDAAPETRRTLLFSATLPKSIVALAQDYQTDAFRIAAASGESGHADIAYVAMDIAPRDEERAVVNILREKDAEAAIIFMSTREGVKRLHAHLSERGFSAVCLSGELSQGERNQALQALRDGRARVCVATDVAARGIDLPHLSLVIHADLPLNAEVMQHRSGRTGRAGRKGTSVLLVAPARRRKAERLLSEAKIRPQWATPPSAETIRALDRERFLSDPLLSEEVGDEDRAMAEVLLQSRSANDIAALLAKHYRARLPEPEEIEPPVVERFEDRPGRKRRDERDTRDKRDRHHGDRDVEPRPSRRRERDERDDASGGAPAVFRLDVGRRDKADPKWLLPMLCRMGGVTRRDIGAIRITDETTEFEVSARAAGDFARNAERNGSEDMTLTTADGAPIARATKPPRKERFQPARARDDKPWNEGPRNDRRRPEAARAERSEDERRRTFKPRAERSAEDGPSGEKPWKQKPWQGKPRPEHAPQGKPLRKQAYEDRPPYGSENAEASSEKPRFEQRRPERSADQRPPGKPPGKKRFDPQTYGDEPRREFRPASADKTSGGDRTFRGGGKTFGGSGKSHAKSGFQHRKGQKRPPET